MVVTLRLSALLFFFNPSVIPRLLSWMSLVQLSNIQPKLCSPAGSEFVARQQQVKILKPGEEGSSGGDVSDTTLFSFDSFGRSRAGCNVSVYLCILQRCVFDQYILFLRLFSISILPLLCTLIMTTMMSLKKKILFLSFKDIKAQVIVQK